MQAILNNPHAVFKPTKLTLDNPRLEKINLLQNVGALNVFKVLTANFMKLLKKKDDFIMTVAASPREVQVLKFVQAKAQA